jgi:hypothetical protein
VELRARGEPAQCHAERQSAGGTPAA